MFNKFIVFLVLMMTNSIFANNISITDIEKSDSSYININSNAKNTTIYIDNELAGKAPIKQYKVAPNKTISILAIIDKNYYVKNIETTIKVKKQTIPTLELNFTKAKAKVFFVGGDGELYINGKFIIFLSEETRVRELEAQENAKFYIQNGYKEIYIEKNIVANSFNKIEYKLKNIPLDIRLYTLSIDNLMWEDTKEAANSAMTWEQGYDYCKNYELAGLKDWSIPSIDQLDLLYKNKDIIYNGFGGAFYWSSNRFQGKSKIWDYSLVKDFENGKTRKSIIEFEQGRIRCVRIIDKHLDKTIKKDIKKIKQDKIKRDENRTKNLERFMLK